MHKRPPVHLWEVGLGGAVLASLVWLALHRVPADWTSVPEIPLRWTLQSLQLWQELRTGSHLGPQEYPPLINLVSALAYSVLGFSQQALLLAQAVFLLPYVGGCWWIGRELGGRGGGVLTLLAAAGNPWFALHLDSYCLEVAITGLVALAFALLLASRGGRVPGPTLALGVVLGLGLLSKQTFALFMGPPAVWLLIAAWREKGSSRKLAFLSVVTLLLTLPALRAALPAHGRAASWFPYLVNLGIWGLVAAAAWRCRRREGWSSGVGVALAGSLGFLVCGWYYFAFVADIFFKGTVFLGQGLDGPPSLACWFGPMASACLGGPAWFVLGTLAGVGVRDLRAPTLAAWSGLGLSTLFFLNARIPVCPYYVLPGIVLFQAVAFGWLGRVRLAPVLLAPGLLVLGVVGLGSWTQAGPRAAPPQYVDGLVGEGGWGTRLVRLPPPDLHTSPAGVTAARILAELERLPAREDRVGMALPVRWNPVSDAVLLEAAERGRILGRDFVPWEGRGPAPGPSLVLVFAAPAASGARPTWLADYDLVEGWQDSRWGVWSLHRRRTGSQPSHQPGS